MSEIIENVKRICKGYRPTSYTWYYQILYDVCKLVSIASMRIKRIIGL